MKKLQILLQAQFDKMCKTGKLFVSSVSGREVWEAYLKGFGQDEKFRDPESSTHNCNNCNNFIRRYGNIVAVAEDYSIMTVFDVVSKMDTATFEEYSNSMHEMHELLKSAKIADVFVETFVSLTSLPYESCKKNNKVFRLGTNKNVKRYTKEESEKFGVVAPNEIRTFHHFFLDVPRAFIDFTGRSIESIKNVFRSSKDVYYRMLLEIPAETVELVRDLIIQDSLLDGTAHLNKLEHVIEELKNFTVPEEKQDAYAWVHSYNNKYARFKNELIGVLCTELAEGMELNTACTNWNKRVDPVNYMKAKSPITAAQEEAARKFAEENGYVESFDREFMTFGDLNINEILHKNVDNTVVKAASIFDKVKKTVPTRHRRSEFEGIEEVGIEKFMKDILPNCTSIEAYLENRHEGNMVNLTKPKAQNAKPIFKWDNPYSLTYNGNLAGKSMIKQNVSKVGGNIEALLRVSLQWNDEDTKGSVDFDLHVTGKNHIYYSNKGSIHSCGGGLDVDMIRPSGIGIENTTWKNKIADGVYEVKVHNFDGRTNLGFKVEIEFDGATYNYFVNNPSYGYVPVAVITVKNGVISIEHKLPQTSTSKDIYGLTTNQFHKVNLVCLSPGHWGSNNVGNKDYLFMLEGCKTDTALKGFHPVDLNSDLRDHRKVLDILSSLTMIPKGGPQLAGLGFNSTVRDEVILKLSGNFKRTIKLKF